MAVSRIDPCVRNVLFPCCGELGARRCAVHAHAPCSRTSDEIRTRSHAPTSEIADEARSSGEPEMSYFVPSLRAIQESCGNLIRGFIFYQFFVVMQTEQKYRDKNRFMKSMERSQCISSLKKTLCLICLHSPHRPALCCFMYVSLVVSSCALFVFLIFVSSLALLLFSRLPAIAPPHLPLPPPPLSFPPPIPPLPLSFYLSHSRSTLTAADD